MKEILKRTPKWFVWFITVKLGVMLYWGISLVLSLFALKGMEVVSGQALFDILYPVFWLVVLSSIKTEIKFS